MLLVETTLGPSPIHGIGLFAAVPIARGTKIWEFTEGFDLTLSEEEVARLSEPCRRRVLQYAYYNAVRLRYVLCSDDARFINHSDQPNTLDVFFGLAEREGETLAARDILPGEEITSDYRCFEDAARNAQYGITPET